MRIVRFRPMADALIGRASLAASSDLMEGSY